MLDSEVKDINVVGGELSTRSELTKAVDVYSAFQDLAKAHPNDFIVSIGKSEDQEKPELGKSQFMSLEARPIVDGSEYDLVYWFEPNQSDNQHGMQERIEIHKPQLVPDMKHPLDSLQNINPECQLIYVQKGSEDKSDPRSLGTTTSLPGNSHPIEIYEQRSKPKMTIDEALKILNKVKLAPKFQSLDAGPPSKSTASITYKQFLASRIQGQLPPLATQ